MALTQVSTGGVKDDSITKAKIPANQIEASELADNAVDTNAIANGAVSNAKIADDAITQAKINVPIINRNLIINGAMQVSQRGTSFAATDQIYMLDRYKMEKSGNAANFTVTQSTTSPDGFAKSLKLDCTAADTSTGSNEFVAIRYKIEAQDLQHLAYGTSAAKALVLSFYVRSNLTGTYGVTCLQRDNSSKLYARTYTINSADTWERKTISIPADTSGVINDDNGSGFEIYFPLVLGSNYKGGAVSTAWETYSNAKFGSQHGVNIGSSTSNEWYLTGLQLEVGSVVTDFEHRSLAQELALCQRYYEENNCTWAGFTRAAQGNGSLYIAYKVTKRAVPTLSTKTAATSVQNLTSQNLGDATLSNFIVDTRINSSGYGRFYDLLAASDAEL